MVHIHAEHLKVPIFAPDMQLVSGHRASVSENDRENRERAGGEESARHARSDGDGKQQQKAQRARAAGDGRGDDEVPRE